MRNIILSCVSIMLTIIFTACSHTHSWQAADCDSPKVCQTCGEERGDALGHDWIDATCDQSKFCNICGLTSGDALEHIWEDATCVNPKTCTSCEMTVGEALGHEWAEATCTEPETCSVCGDTRGDELGHTVDAWNVTIASTCTEKGMQTGICSVCQKSCEEETDLAEHTAGQWEVLEQPTTEEDGTRVKKCTVCNEELDRETFSMSAEELAAQYKNGCQWLSYDTLSRTPGQYEGTDVAFSGYVVQVCSEASSSLYYSTYRVATSGRYDNVVYIKVDNYGSDSRILEDDYITFYGKFDGLYTYETVMGASVTIPCVEVQYIN